MNFRFVIRLFSALAFFLAFTATAAFAQTPSTPLAAHADPAQMDKKYGSVPLQFEENHGQADPSAKYLARGPGYSILLQPTAATFILHKNEAATKQGAAPAVQSEVIRMDLAGANAKAAMKAQQPLKGYVNYMIGTDQSKWQLGLPTFAQTRVSAVYPGVDVVYYGNQRQLEYDFIVAPNADVASIRMSIAGAKPVLAANGELQLQAAARKSDGDLQFHKPVLYQQIDGKRTAVDGAFTIADNGDISFKVGAYDHSRELVIDPIISYASYYGGGVADYITGSTINSANQLYAVGHTYSANLPSTAGELDTSNPYNQSNSGGLGFVTKFSADGSTVLWSTFLGGQASGTSANGVAVNSSDQAYVVGTTGGVTVTQNGLTYTNYPLFPITQDALQPLCGPNGNGAYGNPTTGETSFCSGTVFIAKLSSDGKSLLYGTFLGGSSTDIGVGIALDTAGKIYVTGETVSTGYTYAVSANFSDIPSYPVNNHGQQSYGVANFPTTSTAFQSNIAESIKYDHTDGSGNIIGPADEQAFVSVLSADGHSLLYSSLLGGGNLGNCGNGNCNTYSNAIAVSPQGIAYIGGSTSSASWPITAGAFAAACSTGSGTICPLTGWLAAFDPTKSGAASLLFSTYVTGSSGGTDSNGNNISPGSAVNGLATDAAGNVYATGYTYANNFPTTSGVLQTTCALGYNDGNGDHNTCNSAFVTKLTPAGATLWSTYYRGTNLGSPLVNAAGIAVDSSDDVYVIASSYEPSVPLKHAIVSGPNGTDGLLFELAPDASQLVFGTYIGAVGGITVTNNSLQLDSNLNAYFTGTQTFQQNSTVTFPTTPGAFSQTGFGNSTVSYVAKLITQQQPSATALMVSPNPATPSQTVTLTATVTTTSTLTGTILPTGTVTFYNGTTVIGTGLLNGSGVATYSGTLTAGTYGITASYPGDAGFNSSVSAATSLTVSAAVTTTTTLTVAPSTSAYGTSEVLTATVQAGSAPANAGSVSFAAGAVSFGTASVNAQGVASVTVTPPVGVYSVVATYAGTYNQTSNPNGYGPSASTGAALSVTKASSTTVLTSSTATAAVNTNFTLTATVPTAATGTVNFYNGATALGQGTVAGGNATLVTSFPTANTYSLTAVYSGDTNFNGSTSSVLSQIVAVPAFSVTATPSMLTIMRGSSGTTALIFTPTGGYSGTITLSCGTLPSYATCTFSPQSVTLSGSAVTDELTIGTGTVGAMLSAPHTLHNERNMVYSAVLFGMPASLLALLGFKRRKNWNARMKQLALLAAIGFITLGVMTGCSSSSPSLLNTTPAGTYSLTVTLSPGTGATQTVPLTVVVQ